MRSYHAIGLFTLAAITAAVLSGCGGSNGIAPTSLEPPAHGSAQGIRSSGQALYKMVRLDSIGGTVSAGISITDDGRISGLSTSSGNGTVLAALWDDRSVTNLGTLGGANSAVEWPNHDESAVVGISETSTPDPLGEKWSCSLFIPYTGDTCLGFVWHRASHLMKKLPTLGGNNGYAAGANSSGYAVGWAENDVHDSTCISPQVLQFRAVVWDPARGVHELAPFSADPDSAATAINATGDVVGISGICEYAVGYLSAKHMILWHNGVPTKLKTLGGEGWNTPAAINSADEVVGFSDRRFDSHGNNPNFHAFVWTSTGGTVDIGTLGTDKASEALGVSDSGTIVGISCATVSCASSSAFIYENGAMVDLNSLVPKGSPHLVYANDINSSGEITGLAQNPVTGDLFAFRLTPSQDAGPAGALSESRAGARLRLGPFGRIEPAP